MAESLIKSLEQRAREKPDKPAFIFVNKNWQRIIFTRQEVWDLSRKFAAVLRTRNIGHGDVVCNTLPNSPERLIAQLGTVLAGAVDMNGQICLADGADFIFSLNQGRARAIILDPTDEVGAAAILKSKVSDSPNNRGQTLCAEIPTLEMIIPCIFKGKNNNSELTFLEEIAEEGQVFSADIEPDDECVYMCTSGSTGFFKLVPFTSKHLLEYGRIMGQSIGLTEDSIFLNDRPLGWLGGYPFAYLSLGCTRVLPDCTLGRPENYSSFIWELIGRERCSVMYTVPRLLETLTQTARQQPHASGHKLQNCGCGSGPVSGRHMQALGVVADSLHVVYASTEGGIMATRIVTHPDQFEDFTCGWPTPGSEIKIVDGDLAELPAGREGEIIFRTSQAVSHYVNDVENTKLTFLPDGWIRLGDFGFHNTDGLLSVLGRRKFAILRGPFVIYPDQVEIRIRKCPGVADVVITGVPDDEMYEEICALVIASSDSSLSLEDVKSFCESHLFLNKENSELNPMPKHYLFVDLFPTLSNGKLDRAAVKRLARDLIGQKGQTR